jgi:Luciferase
MHHEPTQGIAEVIEREVGTWPGVSVRSHGSGFLEFRLARRELGHLHGDRLADLPFPVRVREQLVAEGKATLHHAHPESGWVSFYIRNEGDVTAVVDLFRLNYERPWLSR